MTSKPLRLKLLGVGAMYSPRYAPAGLLVLHSAGNVMLDGGPGAVPEPPAAAWFLERLRYRRLHHRSRRLDVPRRGLPGGQGPKERIQTTLPPPVSVRPS
jgi:hypothetical protein